MRGLILVGEAAMAVVLWTSTTTATIETSQSKSCVSFQVLSTSGIGFDAVIVQGALGC
jgi:hypothetical protein